MRLLFSLVWYFFIAVPCVSLPAHAADSFQEDIKALNSVRARLVQADEEAKMPKRFQFLKSDFEKSGGRGRVMFLDFDSATSPLSEFYNKQLGGYYIVVDALPLNPIESSPTIFLKDPVILAKLQAVQKRGIQVLLYATQMPNAFVYDQPEFIQRVAPAAASSSKTKAFLGISPTASRDVVVHELEHIEQLESNHPIHDFLKSVRADLTENEYQIFRRVLEELMAYRAQHVHLASQITAGTQSLLFTFEKDNSQYDVTEFAMEQMVSIIQQGTIRSLQFYFSTLFSHIKFAPDRAQVYCQVVDIVRTVIEGEPTLEQGITTQFASELARCPSGK